ncbi:hypothetical protein GCM10029964_061780 [Kibdelosporangium lantanae]
MRALTSLATEQLRQIRFLQTHTSGWSGKIDTPKGLGLAATRSIAHAEQPLTQPEVVDQLRSFLEHAATTLIRAGEISGITIAIDELDKFADPIQAHEFVNEIKTVFGVANCVFLVSVSDDALASFERRGIPIRDALDSAFATMIAVEPFTLRESQRWLNRQIIGLPSPFACLCYCLSAGIPRELARAAATLDDLYREHEAAIEAEPREDLPRYLRLSEVTERIIAEDVAAKLRAFSYAAQQQPTSAAASDLIVTINTVGKLSHPRIDQLLSRLDDLASTLRNDCNVAEDGTPELKKLRNEAASFCYLSAAIVELFDNRLGEDTLNRLCTGTRPLIDTLAEARRALAVEPLLTWSMVTEMRQYCAKFCK